YRVEISCVPDSASLTCIVTDLVTALTVSGTLTTDIPAGTTALTPRAYASVGGTSSVVGLAYGGTVSEYAVMP
ncbi:MAG: hypothetical protein WBC29_01775, partial [Candidatus Moraniibacteriota bacterium]